MASSLPSTTSTVLKKRDSYTNNLGSPNPKVIPPTSPDARRSVSQIANMWASNGVQRTPSARNVSLKGRSSIHEDATITKQLPNEPDMWTPTSLSRTSSTASMKNSSPGSERTSNDANAFRDRSESPVRIEALQIKPREEVPVREIKRERKISDASIQSHSTLAEPPEEELDLKTPRVIEKALNTNDSQASTLVEPEKAAGPLEQQLLTLLSKVTSIERDRPTVMATEYKALQNRVAELEAEKKTWLRRHEDIWNCRDEDLANLTKIRSMLAQERRMREGLEKLREDDLQNLIVVRGKLAKLTWAMEKQQQQHQQSESPTMRSPASKIAARQSLSQSSDLWKVAKTAAMEQRVLELESANAALRAEIERSRVSAPSSYAPTSIRTPTTGTDVFEGSSRHRERSAAKVEKLRTENEALRRELARKEDENAELEEKIERLQRRLGVAAV
jgi:hypothetical protein